MYRLLGIEIPKNIPKTCPKCGKVGSPELRNDGGTWYLRYSHYNAEKYRQNKKDGKRNQLLRHYINRKSLYQMFPSLFPSDIRLPAQTRHMIGHEQESLTMLHVREDLMPTLGRMKRIKEKFERRDKYGITRFVYEFHRLDEVFDYLDRLLKNIEPTNMQSLMLEYHDLSQAEKIILLLEVLYSIEVRGCLHLLGIAKRAEPETPMGEILISVVRNKSKYVRHLRKRYPAPMFRYQLPKYLDSDAEEGRANIRFLSEHRLRIAGFDRRKAMSDIIWDRNLPREFLAYFTNTLHSDLVVAVLDVMKDWCSKIGREPTDYEVLCALRKDGKLKQNLHNLVNN